MRPKVYKKNGSNFLYYIPIVMMRGNKSFIEYDNEVIILKDWQWVNSNYNFSIDHTYGTLSKYYSNL